MKIAHIDLTGPFTIGMNYQENILSEINAEEGNEVYFIATQYKWEKNKQVIEEQTYETTAAGVHVIRMPFIKLGVLLATERLRVVKGLYHLLNELSPDVIMLHGFQTMSVMSVTKYMRRKPKCRLMVDSHTDYINSAPNYISQYILHRGIYAAMAKSVLKYTSKIWCISYDVLEFSHNIYGIPYDKLEFYPLGGIVFDEEDYLKRRNSIRAKYAITEGTILLVHSGKMNRGKKTIELFEMLKKVKNDRIKLMIVGEMDAEVKERYRNDASEDSRIIYVGWKSGEELLSYLCAADIYMQPGTQSATMQNAACCRCALMLYPYTSHLELFEKNAFYVKNVEEMVRVMEDILINPSIVAEYRKKSFSIAEEKLDYKKLAGKLYE